MGLVGYYITIVTFTYLLLAKELVENQKRKYIYRSKT